MSSTVYIGIDDTDVPGSIGTGRVARGLAQRLAGLGLGVSLGVSRHQLLVDRRIPYTSHNSAKGIALHTDCMVPDLQAPCVEYMQSCFQPGSDPGLCICAEKSAGEEIVSFGRRALSEVLSKPEAMDLAAHSNIFLQDLGGTGDGVIGALAAVGLRAWGNEGRLVDLPGIHQIKGVISVRDLLASTDIASVQDGDGRVLDGGEVIDSLDWIRPSLVGGRPVLRVKRSNSGERRPLWVMIDARHKQTRGSD